MLYYNFFHPYEAASVLLFVKGRFTEAPIYIKGNEVFCKQGTTFIRLHDNHHTSHPGTAWTEITGLPETHFYMGRMRIGATSAQIPATPPKKLPKRVA